MDDTNELSDQTLPFWVTVSEDGDDDAMGMFGRSSEPALRAVPLGPLRKNLAETVDALQQLFADAEARGGTLPLAEAQLSFQVTASGGVQLIGTGQMQGTRGLTLVFKRPS
ncbi:hypothetical protein [Streptomyces sp. NBC_00878]|uniref:Pepco domain-containing protein n=1 Tax=Streptomyces sp. NBC_00878 TaxID=2975854 RepID=UPI0022556936|nr:hypothetical protein [Streptomyces sp. NBC_00878]MCX4906582.1 hypothetical protein [Streptomyces sp. NBC_00878]